MPIVQAKCTNCGGNLEVDNQQEAAVCPYCGTPYIVEKAISNYYTQVHLNSGSGNQSTHVGSVGQADQVIYNINVYGGNSDLAEQNQSVYGRSTSAVPVQSQRNSPKSKMIALLLCIFLGFLGAHRFYVGKYGTAVLWMFTGGLIYIGWIVDIVSIAT